MAAADPQSSLISGAIRHKTGVLHYSLHMAQSLRSTYETVILPRLLHHDVLQCGPDNSYQFLLASRHEDLSRMKPSVVIVCMDKGARKTILKSFGSQWRQLFSTYDIKLRVIVDGGFGAIGDAQQRLDADTLRIVKSIGNSSFCASRIFAPADLDASNLSRPVATLGGIIQVDGRHYGLTVGHAFTNVMEAIPEVGVARMDGLTISRNGSNNEPGQRESGSTFEDVLMYEMDDAEFAARHFHEAIVDSDPDCVSSSASPAFEAAAEMYAVGSTITLSGRPDHPRLDTSTISNTDWALIAPITNAHGPNTFVVPGSTSSVVIDGICNEDHHASSGLVYVIGGRSGTQEGTMNITPSSVTLRHVRYDVWQVRLTRPMSSGDSGSWVIQDGKLYGIIIAASSNLPWAYMLRANKVFDSIRIITGAQAVGLPSVHDAVVSSSHFNQADDRFVVINSSSQPQLISGNEPAGSDSLECKSTELHCESRGHEIDSELRSSESIDEATSWEGYLPYLQRCGFDRAPPLHHIRGSSEFYHGSLDSLSQIRRSFSKSRTSDGKRSVSFNRDSARSRAEYSPAPISLIFSNGSVEHLKCSQRLSSALESNSSGLSIIIKGHIDDSMLSSVGSSGDVDPDFFAMHADLRSRTISPSLPSSQSTVLEIPLITMGFRNLQMMPPGSTKPLHDMQAEAKQAMIGYRFRNGSASFGISQSYVRDFVALSESDFAVEQRCSVWLPFARKRRTKVVIWSDVGKDLQQSPGGPWLESGTWSLVAATRLASGPKPSRSQDQAKPARKEQDDLWDASSPIDLTADEAHAAMHLRLAKSLSEWSKPSSVLQALGPLLDFSAASEHMFLAAIEAQIGAVRTRESPEKVIMYYYESLGRHRAMIDKALHFLYQNRLFLDSSPITQNFEFLLGRIENLQSECIVQRDFVMATWTRRLVDEAHRARQDASSIRRLTLLTILFLPATFITSLFGTNIFELSSSGTGETHEHNRTARLAGLLSLVISLTCAAISLAFWAAPMIPSWYRKALSIAHKRRPLQESGANMLALEKVNEARDMTKRIRRPWTK